MILRKRQSLPAPVFGEIAIATEGKMPSPTSISLDESFDLAYSHIRAKSDRNLIEEMEKEIIRRALQECGGIR